VPRRMGNGRGVPRCLEIVSDRIRETPWRPRRDPVGAVSATSEVYASRLRHAPGGALAPARRPYFKLRTRRGTRIE
jgi:hypothetical protein